MAIQLLLTASQEDSLLPLIGVNLHLMERLASMSMTLSKLSTAADSVPSVRQTLSHQIDGFIQDLESINEQLAASPEPLAESMMTVNTTQLEEFLPLLEMLNDGFADATQISGEFAALLQDLIAAISNATTARLALHEEMQAAQMDRTFLAAG